MSPVYYLPSSNVLAARESQAPHNYSRTGYGSKLPTRWELQLADKRWRRVYVVCFSNSGSAYVLVNGKPQYLGMIDPRDPASFAATGRYIQTSEGVQLSEVCS